MIRALYEQFDQREGSLGDFKLVIPDSESLPKRINGNTILMSLSDYKSKVEKYEEDLEVYENLKEIYNEAAAEILEQIRFEELEITILPEIPRAPVPPIEYGSLYYGEGSDLSPYVGYGAIVSGQIHLDKYKYGQYKHFGVFGQGDTTEGIGFTTTADTVDEEGEPVCQEKTLLVNVYPLSDQPWTQDPTTEALILGFGSVEAAAHDLAKPDSVEQPVAVDESPFTLLAEQATLIGAGVGLASLAFTLY